jgi:CDP-glucose 4,6-dehydratase
MTILNDTFKDKTVLITGDTGFKGSWLAIWLNFLGAKVIGLSKDIPTNPSNYEVSEIKNFIEEIRIDIQDSDAVRKVVTEFQPDFVFHLAAQALVRLSYENPLETLNTNAMGSVNLLDALRSIKKNVVAIMITSDKAYDNVEWAWGYRESDRLGGKDPYSASKGMAELAIRAYVESFFNIINSNVRVGITRAGNVIGGGDWAKDRIVPDCIKAWSNAEIVDIRNPNATRPWQHVLEPLSGYLLLASSLSQSIDNHGQAFNFGPSSRSNYSVGQLIDEMKKSWDKAIWNDISNNQNQHYEAALLKLNCDKALFDLDWSPTLEFEETIKMTIDWYKKYFQDQNLSMHGFTISQIKEYTRLAQLRDIRWARND